MASTPADEKNLVFVSYSHADSATVSRLMWFLRSYFVIGQPWPRRIFIDRERLTGVQSLNNEIFLHLNKTERLLFCCSQSANHSEWVQAELRHFLKTKGQERVIVCLVGSRSNPDDSRLPEQLSQLENKTLPDPLERSEFLIHDFRHPIARRQFRENAIRLMFATLGKPQVDILGALRGNLLFIALPLYAAIILLLAVSAFLLLRTAIAA